MSDAGSVAAAASQPEALVNNEEDAASVDTSTTDFLPRPNFAIEADPEERLHQLGLHINHPWGWSGSGYDDYEYA